MARKPLGRGLSALLGDERPASEIDNINEIDIGLIEPNPEQPRTRFSEQALDELAASITSNGIVQPIVVRKRGERYQIVAGERRWRASQRAGLRKVPVVVRNLSDEKLLEVALIENIQRQELNPIEEAKAYKKLIENIGLTQEQVAKQVGKERSLISTSIRLLKLPNEVLEHIEEGRLSAGHGRALLMIESPAEQKIMAKSIISGKWSVRETERTIKKISSKSPQLTDNKEVTSFKDPNIAAAETKLKRKLGTNVIISVKQGGGGKIEIEYYGISDLDRLYQLIMRDDDIKY